MRRKGSHGILVIGGPTATGKTAAALHVACLWGARLISADAMQVYRELDIGTGKPPRSVLDRYPHACIDIRGASEPFDAADFVTVADAEIAAAADADRPVVVVGGTSFYLRALLTGIAPAPSGDADLRAELEQIEDPHAELRRVDPVLAERLHPNDRVRVLRGLEVHWLTGEPLSDIHQRHRQSGARHEARRIWLDRPDLDERIDGRVLWMISRGYVGEVRNLLEKGVSPSAKPMRSLGYRHLAEHCIDGLELDEAIRRTQRDSRRFARKQRTFLKGLGGFEQMSATDRRRVLDVAASAFGEVDAR